MKEHFDGDRIEGVINIHNERSGTFISEDGSKFTVPKKYINQSLHQDKVLVELYRPPHRDRLTAQVVSVLERTNKEIVGTVDKKQKTCFVVPDKGGTDFHIRREYRHGVKNGDRVRIKLLEWKHGKRRPEGEVIEIFGQAGEHDAEIKSIISKFDLQADFPEEVILEADAIEFELDESEVANRLDLRDKFTFTIDPESARDFDDAISFERLDDGWVSLGVHIADVTHYMRPNSALDKEAYQRATSIYLVDRVIPMLPEKLSNGVCSLRPDEDKFTFSFMCEISAYGKIRKEKFIRTAIRSDKRLTYEQAQDIIDGIGDPNTEVNPKVKEAVTTLNILAKNLRQTRMNNHALEFSSRQPKFILDDEDRVVDIEFDSADDAHNLIEELMLLANRKVSKFLSDRPSVYRCHEQPPEDKLIEVKNFLGNLGYDLDISGGDETKKSMSSIMREVQETPLEHLVRTVLVRTMSKAYYSSDNIGHYGLGFEFYTHFTSPIRRYPDVLIHRLLHEKLSGSREFKTSKLEAKSIHASSREIYAANAQRESIAFKQAEWISDKIGEKFDAVISDVKKWGVYVELVKSGCRGLVSQDELNGKGFVIDEENYCIKGSNKYTVGDVIRVECLSVNMQMRLIDFGL